MVAGLFAAVTAPGRETGTGTGAELGRWIDQNFALALTVSVVSVATLLVSFGLLARGYRRQRRRNRRLQRHQELLVQAKLEALHTKVEELREDIGQLGELEDHVVGQLRLMRKLLDPQEGPNGATTAPINPWAAPAMAGTPAFASRPSTIDLQDRPPIGLESAVGAPATLVETGEPLAWATQRG